MESILIFIFTEIASVEVFIALVVACLFILFAHKQYELSLSVIVAVMLNSILVTVLKNELEIPRPPNPLVPISGYGFPSGHAAGVVVLATVLWSTAIEVFKKRSRVLNISLLVLITLVCWSRVYLGVHDIPQVLGGLVVGTFSSGIIFYYLQRNKLI